MPQLEYIALDKIRESKVSLRTVNRNGEGFMQLVQSVKAQGVLNPVLLKRVPGEDGKEFQLVDGLQRFTSATEVGTGVVEIKDGHAKGKFIDGPNGPIGVIPAQIVERDEADTLVAQMIGNIHRIETRPVEYSKAIIRYLAYNPLMTETELAVKLNKSPVWVGKTLSLDKLVDQAKPLVDDGHINVGNAYVLAKLPPEEQLLWMDRAQTQRPDEFSAGALARAKEIRDSNRKGMNAVAETFKPIRHLRKKNELDEEADNPRVLPALIRELDITKDIKPNAQGLFQAACAGAKLALDWFSNFDPKGQEIQKAKDANRKKAEKDAQERRKQEKKDKEDAEALERATQAQRDAAAARLDADKAAATT